MTRIVWGAPGERFYEVGVDRGVLYVDGNEGVPWNGLISVTEEPSGGEGRAYYFEGVKYRNKSAKEEYEATVEAYTYPPEFGVCDGTAPIKNGLFATQQPRKPFSLSYRSLIGNDSDGFDHGYKLHLVYDALAAPSSKAHTSMSGSVEPFNFSWKLTTKPFLTPGYRPNAHFEIDSRETPAQVLAHIENILYGTEVDVPRIPSVLELMYIFESYNSSIFSAGSPIEPYYATFDGGIVPELQTSTVDGGAP